MKAAGFFSLATSKCPPGSSTAPSPRDPSGSDHACAISLRPSTARSIDATTFNALGSISSTRGGVSWSNKTRPRPSAQTASIWESRLGSIEPESFAMLLVCQSNSTPIAARLGKPRDLRHPIADRDQKHLTVSAATQANTRDLAKWHVDHAAHSQPVLVRLTASHGSGFLLTSRRMCNHCWMISRVLCSIHFRKNEMLACYPNWPECERDRGLFAIRRLYEPKVDELFLTHLLVLPPTRIFLSGRFSIRTSSSVKLTGLSLEFLDLVRGRFTRRVASQPLLAE